ncbi:hypothetical protein GC174_14795 [bacterium]|nr:hypothetical protein [bacterium]
MTRLYHDVETGSPEDINRVGGAAYLSNPDARFLSLVYALDEEKPTIVDYWEVNAWRGEKIERFTKLLLDPTVTKVAHYATFERRALSTLAGHKTPPEQWSDTYFRAGYYGYPRGLDDCAKALGSPVLKDLKGKAAMLELGKGNWTPEDKPLTYQNLYHYNVIDVEVLRWIDKALPEAPEEMQRLWCLSCKINERGVPIDTQAVNNAVVLRQKIQDKANADMAAVTEGRITTVNQTDRMKNWALLHGVFVPDCGADTVARVCHQELPPPVKRVFELRRDNGLSSLSKFATMKAQHVDGRLYDAFDPYGAHTGRFTSAGFEDQKSSQLHNLARAEDPEKWADVVANNPDMLLMLSNPAEKLKHSSRGMIKADEGNTLLGTDLKQIEARATGWAAGEQRFTNLFTSGRDPYAEYATQMFGRTITKNDLRERTAGKASVLSFGFAGGIGAGQRSSVVYKMDLHTLADAILPSASPEELATAHYCYDYYMRKQPEKPLSEREALAVDIVKQRYRRDFSRIPEFWDELENAFLYGGEAGPIKVEIRPGELRVMTLPSGRQLFYHGVHIHSDGRYHYMSRRGPKFIWKGTLVENVAQAINADCSFWYMMQADEIAPVVHHCHDEFTMEVAISRLAEAKKRLEELCSRKPSWADGLPLEFDFWDGPRYGK